MPKVYNLYFGEGPNQVEYHDLPFFKTRLQENYKKWESNLEQFLNKYKVDSLDQLGKLIENQVKENKELKKATSQELILDYQNIIDKLQGRTVEKLLQELTEQTQTIKKLETEQVNLSTNLNKQKEANELLKQLEIKYHNSLQEQEKNWQRDEKKWKQEKKI